MSGIDIFTCFVLLVMIASAVVVFVVLGVLPGKVARQRQHPQGQALGSRVNWVNWGQVSQKEDRRYVVTR